MKNDLNFKFNECFVCMLMIRVLKSGKSVYSTFLRKIIQINIKCKKGEKKSTNNIRDRIVKTPKSFESKDSRYCKTCKKVRELEEFRDETLKTKYGNVCNSCRKPRSNFWRYKRYYRRRW